MNQTTRTQTAAKTTCTACGARITPRERRLGWPIQTLDGHLSCPECYGDEAYGPDGEVLPATGA